MQEIGDGAIAIIGMAGRFPDARDLDAFWDNIAAARCSVREIDRFDIAPFFDATRGRPGKTYAKWAATLPDHDRFDPLFFAISPAEAEAMDPQQRVLLEEAWHALEDAGLTPESLQGARCGVFVGASANSYRADAPPSLQSLGGSMAILSARLSYLLDLKGPTFPVDTGCSSSLTALHLARQSLAAGESDLALAAGVSCNLLSPEIFLYLADAGMASPEGRCKSFDDGADGFAPGEGVGVLVLKRLDDALRDGDRIHALIRGTGINQDGKTSGLTAPSATAQTDLECEVYRAAKVDPATIGLVEAHGTGTKLGDPIEIAALTDAFAAFTGEKGFCAIGSVKTNIGHAMAAAGIAGALKAVLALREKVLPPSLHFSKPNRHIDFASSPFFVNVAARVWASAGPRRAAVSSFSFSGANAHIVLEEAPAADVARDVGPWLFALSAKSEAALARRLADLARWLERHSDAHPADVAFTLGRRAHFRFRRAFVAGSLAELAAALGGAPAPASAPGDLARRYEAGETLDFASRGRLLSLPGYPFERELYWRPQATAAAPALTALAAHWLTRDHVIRGRKLLPGAAFLELARAAAGLETGVLRDVAWRAVVDVTERDLPLRLDVDGTRCTLRAEGTIFATAVAEAASPAPRSLDLAAIGARCAVRRDGAEIYAAAARGGYDYGPAYRVIADVALGEGEALARLAAPADGGWRLHPALLDGAFQTAACIGLADETDGRAYVPFALESFEIHAARAPRFVHARRVGAGEGLHRFDVALCDDAGVTLAFCRGLEARALKPAAAQETLLLAPVSRPLAPPAAVRPADTILAFASEEICARLRASGARVIGVRPGDGFSRLAPDRFAIDPGAAEDYERLLAETAPLAALVAHLWTIDATTAPACAPSLSAALDALGPEIGARSLWLTARAAVRSDAVARLVFATRPGPIASAAAGLARSVLRESSRVACTAIESEDGDLDALARELTLDPAPPVVSLREGQRFEIRLEEWAPPASHVAREDGAIVITGGAGAIGLRVAKHLARSGYSKLALIGRRAPDAALQETIGAIESAGADVLHLVADVSSGAALRAALDKARRRFGSIIGVIHAAGVLHDGRMAEQEAENFDAVWSPKARGAVALDHLTASDPLDFFLLFSSTAARFGSAGQGAYAAANGFFAGFAAWRRSSGRPGRTVAIDWPLWENGAMAPAPEVAAELERVMGLSPMPDVAACAALDAALHADVTELVVLHGRGEALRAFAAAPFRAQDARAPSAPGARAPVEDYLKSVVAEATRLAPARIDAAERFEAYGVDSMMILRMNARLEQDLGALPKTLFFEHQTIADLAARLLADHGAALVARFGEPLVNPPEPMLAAAPIAASADAPIAIIGIAGLYPQARTLGAFWRNLAEGRDCIVEIPEDRWPLGGFYDPDRQRPETSYSKWGGFIDGVDEFDAPFFNISPREADALDPQARKFLEIAWAAMEDSGLTRETLFRNDPQRRGGVFVGVMYGDYQLFGPQEAARGKLIAPNAAYWNIANRVSFWLDMHGPSMAVDTACSSSLSAIHLACAALRNGECSVAFAGGVNLTIHPSKHWILSKSGFASSDGRCRSFGAGGDGYVPGEGVGAVLLKPLDRALADGDRVHAVLRSSAVNHGGRTNGYTVPNPAAHADLIAEALRRGGVAPDSVSYIEAHGTGTALGDPVEVAGLARVFAGAPKSLPIGSVKSNIGHLESAAGIAALTKVALQLRHAQLAPSLHAQTLNPAIDFARTPFVVQQSLAPWRARDAAPRRAGISSFGAGGANAHLVVEEAPAVAVSAPWRGGALLAPLSAATPAALREQAQRLADWLDGEGREADLAAVVRTLQTGREAMRHRALFSTATIAELATALRRFAADGAPPVAPEAGRAWVEGGRMDWEALPPGPRRPVSLPTYAFEKRRCWVELSPRAGASAQTLALIAAPDDPLVADHRLGEAVVLAGAFLLEAARRAGERTRPIVAAEDVEFLRPVRPQMNATIAVEPDGRFVIAVGDTPHARGRLFCDSPAAAPEPAPLAAVAQRCAETIEHESIYAALAAGGAHYGPRYRRLARLRRGAGEILADLSGAWADAGWPADLVDAALQTSFALVSEPGGFAPFSIERLTRWADVSAAAHVHGRRREAGPGFVTLDLDITDRDGRVLLAIAGMTARRVSETLPLRRLRPLWTPVVAEAASTASGTLAVRGGGVLAAAVRAAWSGETRDFVEDMNCESAWWFVETDGVAEDEAVIRFSAAVRALAARPRPPALTVVTRGAWAVLPDEQPDPAGAAVAAFAQSVRREHPEFRLRVVDVDADCTADALLRLPVGEGDFALRRGALWRKSLVETSLPEPRDPWRRGGRYLIVGGAGGIGLALAEHLVRRAGARVALLGRRPLQPAIAERLAAIGGEIVYVEADVADAAALEAAVETIIARFGGLDGAFHLALAMHDARAVTLTGEQIRAVMAPKARGTRNLFAALRGHALDFVMLFSSSNAHTTNPGQSAYAAASAAQDAIGLRAAPWPVKVIDWGFWGEVGRVAAPEHHAALARVGVYPIATSEGFETVERLLASPLPQIAPLRVGAATAAALGLRDAGGFEAAVDAALEPARQGAASLAAATRDFAGIGDYAAQHCLRALRALGVARRPGESLDAAALGVAPRHAGLFAALVDMLARAGFAAQQNGAWVTTEAVAAAKEDELAQKRAGWIAERPEVAPYLDLLDACVMRLPDVLRGAIDANDVLFPGGSAHLVEPIYRGNAIVDHFQSIVATSVAAAVERRLTRLAPGETLRIIEIGGGTGGTTAFLLPALTRFASRIEFTFTDVGRMFLDAARRRFADYSFLTVEALDIERSPQSQGFAAQSFDIVVAANVLHATREIAATLAHVGALLREGGLLLLNEATSRQDFNTLTFGLTSGWWKFADGERRIAHSPLLDAASWRIALAEQGFGRSETLAGGEGALQSVIVAELERAPVAAATAATPIAAAPAELEALLRATIARSLRLAPEELELDRSFADYGADLDHQRRAGARSQRRARRRIEDDDAVQLFDRAQARGLYRRGISRALRRGGGARREPGATAQRAAQGHHPPQPRRRAGARRSTARATGGKRGRGLARRAETPAKGRDRHRRSAGGDKMMIGKCFAKDLFRGKTVFVTGGGGTINAGIARGFAELGANLALCGRTLASLEAAAASIRALSAQALVVEADVQRIETLEAALAATERRFGKVDVLICGAAANFPAPAEQMTADGFAKVIAVDLMGSFNAARAAFPHLKATKGNIIFVSATNALMPFAFQAHVGAAKAGIDSLMRGLALEWGKYGIRCNSILPGPIEQTEGLRRLLTAEDIAELSAYVPIGRFGTIEDCAAVCCFLASPAASLLTGVALVADGGQSFSGSAMLAELMMNP
nr:SDR family NAD(P)-dependent oxidoreductase [Methylosinus trichosporium]